MKLTEYENFYHVDISTQIDNKWKNDSVLAIVKGSERYSIKIKARDKEEIKRRFIIGNKGRSEKRHNKKIVAIVYSYLLYKSLSNFKEANPLLLCRDVRPERAVMHFLRRIARFLGNPSILNREIKFRKKVEFETEEKLPKSLAGKYAKKVYQGKIESVKIIDKHETGELIEIIGKIS